MMTALLTSPIVILNRHSMAHAVGRGLGSDTLAFGQSPVGSSSKISRAAQPQFQVNTYTSSWQYQPSVAIDADGEFVVVWQSSGSGGTDTDDSSILGQRFDSSGAAQGSEFQVNSYTTNGQDSPTIAMDADGDFVVTWRSLGSDGSDPIGSSIQAQRFNASGVPQGNQIQVNSYTSSSQSHPAVSMDLDGDFVVAWQSYGSSGTDTDYTSIQAQRYDASGSVQGGQFQVNTYTTNEQRYPAVALDDSGDFVVVWWSYGSDGADTYSSIQAQRYNSAGSSQGGQFLVNTNTFSYQTHPAVALDSDGDFIVAWQSYVSSGTDSDRASIQAQRYNSSGTPQGGEFQVNSYTTGYQKNPAVAMDADGNIAIAWQSYGSSATDSDSYSVQAQFFASTGAPQGGEFQVNSYTNGHQWRASAALGPEGAFVVAWESDGSVGNDTDGQSIQARQFISSSSYNFQVNLPIIRNMP
jgi:hypothetical protein